MGLNHNVVPREIHVSPDVSGEFQRGDWERLRSNCVQNHDRVQGDVRHNHHDGGRRVRHNNYNIPAVAERNREGPRQGTCRGKYTPLLDGPRNDFLKGHNNYPETVLGSYSLLLHYKSEAATYSGNIIDVDAQSFATNGTVREKKENRRKAGEKEEIMAE